MKAWIGVGGEGVGFLRREIWDIMWLWIYKSEILHGDEPIQDIPFIRERIPCEGGDGQNWSDREPCFYGRSRHHLGRRI